MNADQFSNPRGVVDVVRRAAQRFRPDWVEPEDRARAAMAEAAEHLHEAGRWRDARKLERFTERMFKNEGGAK